jgi:hypothetical protein
MFHARLHPWSARKGTNLSSPHVASTLSKIQKMTRTLKRWGRQWKAYAQDHLLAPGCYTEPSHEGGGFLHWIMRIATLASAEVISSVMPSEKEVSGSRRPTDSPRAARQWRWCRSGMALARQILAAPFSRRVRAQAADRRTSRSPSQARRLRPNRACRSMPEPRRLPRQQGGVSRRKSGSQESPRAGER